MCINFQIYFGSETLHVSGGSSVHHQEIFTVHSAYVIQTAFEQQQQQQQQDQDGTAVPS
jgi:hypothetical protein